MNEQKNKDDFAPHSEPGNARRPKDRLPPELTLWREVLLWAGRIVGSAAFVCALDQLWFKSPFSSAFLQPSIKWAYIGLLVALTALILELWLRHPQFVHDKRLEDRSEVEAKIAEAMAIEPWLADQNQTKSYSGQKTSLVYVVNDLWRLGAERWTEFQVLRLDKELANFIEVNSLKTRALSNLAYFEEFGEDKAYRYDERQYLRWKKRIEEAIKNIDDSENSSEIESSQQLRAELKELFEEIAHYDADWVEGTVILRALMVCGVAAIVVFLMMGLIPIAHPMGDGKFGVYNWGLFGVVGSLIAVLRELRNSNLVEIGNTDGKKEVWRAVLGAALGLVAGVVTWAMIGGGILVGSVFPKFDATIDPSSLQNVALSILVGVAAGYSFERVYDRMRSNVEAGS